MFQEQGGLKIRHREAHAEFSTDKIIKKPWFAKLIAWFAETNKLWDEQKKI
jgi:hypothetical protein